MSEHQVGDRVRTLVASEGIPEGTKGNVIFCNDSGSVVVAKINGEPVQANFYNNQLEVIASHGEIERTRMMHGIGYAGLNLPEELLEAEGHIRELVDSGYSYRYIESFLMSNGYGYNVIRRAFTKLTGMSPEQAVNIDAIYSPGSIPQFNYAWGMAKKGKEVYFIMSIANKYIIFCQKDDMCREEHASYLELMEAKDALKKLVKKLMQWDPPVKDVKKQITDSTQLYKQPQLFMKAGEIQDWALRLNNYGSVYEREAMIRQAYDEDLIDEAKRDFLLQKFADAEAQMEETAVREKLDDIEKEKMDRPIRDEIAEKTPAQFFQKHKMQNRYSMLPADVVDTISRYLYQANADLQDFEVEIHSLKYATVQPAKKKGKGSPASTEPADIMDATASVSVLVEVTDNKAAEPYNAKLGLMVFNVIGTELYTSDTIKGEDDWVYALTDEGLSKYFQSERQMSVTKK
jgi:hypothetical protein